MIIILSYTLIIHLISFIFALCFGIDMNGKYIYSYSNSAYVWNIATLSFLLCSEKLCLRNSSIYTLPLCFHASRQS